jgi:hypothetical protein
MGASRNSSTVPVLLLSLGVPRSASNAEAVYIPNKNKEKEVILLHQSIQLLYVTDVKQYRSVLFIKDHSRDHCNTGVL